MTTAGWYRMHRGWMDHAVFRGEPFERRAAFMWLIEHAAFTPSRVSAPGGQIEIERGQLSCSIRYLAKAWSWDEKRVRRFLTSVQEAEIIALGAAAGQTLVTICNYDKYQTSDRGAAAPSAADAPQARRGAAANNKKEEEYKKEEEPRGRGRRAREYAFEGTVVRLTQADFDAWRLTYHAIPDLVAELRSIDAWFVGRDDGARKGWFQHTARMLNRTHQQSVGERQAKPAGNLVHFDAAIRRMERFEQQERERQERERTAGERA
jgi:hypothetical protein